MGSSPGGGNSFEFSRTGTWQSKPLDTKQVKNGTYVCLALIYRLCRENVWWIYLSCDVAIW